MSPYSEYKPEEPTNDQLAGAGDWIKNHLWVVIVGGILALVLIIVVSVVGFLNWQRDVAKDGYEWQNNTVVKYRGVQTTLSTCLDNTQVASQVAEQDRKTLRDTLTAVVQARYVDANGNAIDVNTQAGQALIIKIIQERYPDISSDLYKQLMTIAVGCRNEVSGAQKDLQEYAGRFQTWTKGGNIFDGAIREGFPNDELQVEGLDGTLKGKAALKFIAEPILTSEATTASKTHTMPQQTVFPSSAAPTASATKK